ncbi:MAG: hypothetical protein CMJ16_08920 [Peredibacter sp.]|nr:hypothetical protein [Peredibacter sp.]
MKIREFEELPQKIRPRDYQLDSLKKIIKFLKGDSRAFLTAYPMGAGKSHLISLIANLYDGEVLVLSPSVAIKDQLYQKTKDFKRMHSLSEKVIKKIERCNLEDVSKEHVVFSTYQAIYHAYANDKAKYDLLNNKFDLVLVDEGHREPAQKWSYSIRGLDGKKVLFTATPYRNDFNVFDFENKDMSVVTYGDLAKKSDQNYLSEVRFKKESWSNIDDFLVKFNNFFDLNNQLGYKSIIRCSSEDSIRKIVKGLNKLKKNTACGVHSNFSDEKDLYENYSNAIIGTDYKVFVHQYKLVEGVDDKTFCFLALYDDFSNDRSLVQQVGRLLRPYRSKNGEILIQEGSKSELSWDYFVKHDAEVTRVPTNQRRIWGIREFSNQFVKNLHNIFYESDRFKDVFTFRDDKDFKGKLLNSIRLKKRVRIYEVLKKEGLLKVLKERIGAETLDRYPLGEWEGKDEVEGREIEYFLKVSVALKGNEILEDVFFPELILSVFGFVCIKDYVFLINTDKKKIDLVGEELDGVSKKKINRLYSQDVVFTQVSLGNIDISEEALRQRTVSAKNLNDSLSSNSDFSYFVKNAFFKEPNKESSRKYLSSFSNRYSEYDNRLLSFNEYKEWVARLCDELNRDSEGPAFLNRFAKVVTPDESWSPEFIMIDLVTTNLKFLDEHDYSFKSLEELDNTFEIKKTPGGREYFEMMFEGMSIEFNLKRTGKRFRIEPKKIKDFELLGKLKKVCELINKNNFFIISFKDVLAIYSHGNYYEPQSLEFLKDIIISDLNLKNSMSEKGDDYGYKNVFDPDSIFGYMTRDDLDYEETEVLWDYIFEYDYMLIDDRSNNEIADFILLKNSGGQNKIALAHCKSKGKKTSGGALYDISGQVLKNLRYVSPVSKNLFREGSTVKESTRFNRYTMLGYDLPRLYEINKGQLLETNLSSTDIIGIYQDVLKRPSTSKEIWMIIGGGFNSKQVIESLSNNETEEAYYLSHAKYIITSLWAAVSSVGANLKIFG